MAKRLCAGSALCVRGPRGPAPLLLVGLALLGTARAREEAGGGFSLHPPYFNLAEGARIAASATCGEEAPARGSPRPTEDLYCKLVGGPVAGGDPNQTIQGQYCDICTAANSNRAHPASNAIDGTERWWQSPPLSRGLEYNEVNVTLDLGQVFHVAYVLIKFANSPRPDLWVLERSMDFGRTYQPWQFFACESLPPRGAGGWGHTGLTVYRPQIVVSLVNGRPGAMNFSYSPLLREFTKATNVRLRFLRTNTLLGHLMGKALRDPTVTRRYYYSIKDISIGGRCVCHGHADACDAKDPTDPLQCTCQHNTCGGTCDRCCPGFNQQPWKPATANSANECQSCNCHGHATDCYYDPEVDQRRASQSLDGTYQGGGVCIDCQHHTTGVNCERCLPGFYRSPDHPLDSPHVCRRCNCESNFTDGTCEDLTGRCYCRPNFSGERCDVCAEGFTGFPSCYREHLPGASEQTPLPARGPVCSCSPAGTLPEGCDEAGRCPCQPGFAGPHCDQCHPGYHGFPNCQRTGSLCQPRGLHP
uniref:Laminin subunit alpha-5 n=1 Tax=Theropithecus gelada TaxID=9565 RepID=A0A8D2JZF2_THEGE